MSVSQTTPSDWAVHVERNDDWPYHVLIIQRSGQIVDRLPIRHIHPRLGFSALWDRVVARHGDEAMFLAMSAISEAGL